MKFKILVCASLIFATLSNSVPIYAEGMFDDGSGTESADLAGEYLSQIIELINENYMGGDITIEELVEAAINGMAHSLDDYTEYYTQAQYDEILKTIASEVYSPNIEISINESGYPYVKIMYDGGGRNSGMKNNDIILSIDGVSTQNMSYDEVVGALTSRTRKTLHIVVSRRKQEVALDVALTPVAVTTVKTVSDISSLVNVATVEKTAKVGYIKMTSVGDGTPNELKAAIRELKRTSKDYLILDMRGNKGGYVAQAVEICKQLVPSGTIITTKDKQGNITTYTSTLEKSPFLKMVVLTDKNTASASEIIVSALQDSGAALVIGQQTYGKGVMQSVTELNGLGILKITAYEYFSRNGRKINGIGISPNVEVNDVLFLSADDKLDGARVKAGLSLLGYTVKNESDAQKAIGSYQKKNGLQVTYMLDNATINSINTQIYANLSADRTLTQGYYAVIN